MRLRRRQEPTVHDLVSHRADFDSQEEERRQEEAQQEKDRKEVIYETLFEDIDELGGNPDKIDELRNRVAGHIASLRRADARARLDQNLHESRTALHEADFHISQL